MSLSRLLTGTCRIVRRLPADGQTHDAAGDPVATFDVISDPIPCRLEHGIGTETDGDDRDSAVHTATIFLPPDADVGPRDRVVTDDGVTWEIDGPPIVHRTPRGPHHVEARLRWVEGA